MISVEESLIRVQGRRLLVRSVGQGKPVLLVNGLGAHTAMWETLEHAFEHRRVISFDAPGTGGSPVSVVQPSVRALAEIAIGILDALDVDRADVLGYSFGGAVAQELAWRFPERVDDLVLAATTPGWGGVPGRWRAMMLVSTPWRYYSRWHLEHTIGAIAGGQARNDPAFVAHHSAQRLRQPPHPLAYMGQVVAGMRWSSLSWLDQIQARTLVLAGSDDPLTPTANAVLIAAQIPEAQLLLVAGEGHLMLLDERSASLPAIAGFLDGDDPGARIDAATLKRAFRQSGLGVPPWGPLSAMYRCCRLRS